MEDMIKDVIVVVLCSCEFIYVLFCLHVCVCLFNENEDDTDSENEDDTGSENEDEDTFAWLDKDKNRIKKMIEEFEERGNNYFKHCNKEKIEIIGTWCNQLLNNQSKMVKNTEILKNIKKTLTPVRSNIRKLADSNYPISKQRKMLKEVQVGNCSSSIY